MVNVPKNSATELLIKLLTVLVVIVIIIALIFVVRLLYPAQSPTPPSTIYATSSVPNPATSSIPNTSTISPPSPTIVITNSQPLQTSSPFQQIVTFNPSAYSAYEATDLGNIRFYQGSTELYSWCESGCSSSSTDAVFWLKLPEGINAYSSVQVNVLFGPKYEEYDGIYAGEAPQLSSIYGQYDNGANVFLIYFNGDASPSLFTTSGGDTVTQTTATFGAKTINVLRYTLGCCEEVPSALIYVGGDIPNQYVTAESSFQSDGRATDIGVIGLGQNSGPGLSDNLINTMTQWGGPTPSITGDYFDQAYVSSGSRFAYLNAGGAATTDWRYASVTYSNSTSFSGYIAPQLYKVSDGYYGVVNANPIANVSSLYLLFYPNVGASGHWVQFNWARVRAYPPNGVMPSAILTTA